MKFYYTWRCLPVLLIFFFRFSAAYAQITLDGTMGVAGALTGPNFTIPAAVGQTRGSNLFHSFGQFNVLTNQSATFTGPNSISNIFGRVTGGQASTIDGTIRSQIPNANLYLMNPAGMVFGPNAFLDVQGSFHVTTADYLKFADGVKFHADLSRQSTLTTAEVSAFGFLSQNPAGIAIQGSVLQVPIGNTLSVVGGDVDIMGDPFFTSLGFPTLSAFNGTLQLASVMSPGELPQAIQNAAVSSFERMGTISLANAAYLDASSLTSGPMGTVIIRGGRLHVDNSFIFADNFGSMDGNGFGVDTRIGGMAIVANNSSLTTHSFGSGNARDLQLTAESLQMENSLVGSRAFASGDGGNVTVKVGDLILGAAAQIAADAINENVLPGARAGNARDVTVEAKNINVTGGAQISSGTFGPGNGGTVRVTATDTINLDGPFSGIFAVANSNSTGSAGAVLVEAQNVKVTGGAQISSSTFGPGNGGSVGVTAGKTISLEGAATVAIGTIHSGIFASNEPGNTGDAGNILVQAENLSGTNGAAIASNTFGSGKGGMVTVIIGDGINLSGQAQDGFGSSISAGAGEQSTTSAGDVAIEARNLTVTDGARISSSTFGMATGGSVRVSASDTVRIDGGSGIFAQTESQAATAGNAGNIVVTANNVVVTGGSQISGATFGQGRGGTVRVSANNLISLDGAGEITRAGAFGSGINTNNQPGSTGDAGDVVVEAKNVQVTGGAAIASSTFGPGKGGTVHVKASDTVALDGSVSSVFGTARSAIGASSEPGNTGPGGDIIVAANKVRLTGGATITATSLGVHNAGNIDIVASDSFRSQDSSVTTQADFADGGNIHLKVGKLVELVNSQITTSVQGGAGAGGNILIDPQFVILNNSQITANAFGGPGGKVTIIADNFLATPDSAVTASSTLSTPGTVDIQAPITDLSGSLAPLPESIVQATTLLRQSCAARYSSGKASTLASPGKGGMPFEPGRYMASAPYRLDTETAHQGNGLAGERLAANLPLTFAQRFSIYAPCS